MELKMDLILPDGFKPTGDHSKEQKSLRPPDTSPMVFSPKDIEHEFTFFNHGVFFSHGDFKEEEDPVGDWYRAQSEPVDVLKQAYNSPIFEGLDAPTMGGMTTWNNVLCGVNTQFWPSLLEYLAGIAIHNPKKRWFALTYYGRLEIVDPACIGKIAVQKPPTVKCYVFCLSSGDARYEFARPLNVMQRPKLQKLPPTAFASDVARQLDAQDTSLLSQRLNPAHAAFHREYREALERGPIIEGYQ